MSGSVPTSVPASAPTSAPDLSVLDVRPPPGQPRPYQFPRFERTRLSSGMTLITAHVEGRPLLAAQLLLAAGGDSEPAEQAGVSALTARALPEGTATLGAVEFTEAAERLGAEIHAEASWEALTASLEVPRSRFAPALGLLAQMVRAPALPEREVERLRDERINDLHQVWLDPRRRAERVFAETIYSSQSAYSRPLGGVLETVERLGREQVVARHRAALAGQSPTLVVAGDLTGLDVVRLVEEHDWSGASGGAGTGSATTLDGAATAAAAGDGPRIVVVDRPAAPQSEIRIGHVGLSRRTPDFHAVSVLNAILGGTFGSRLNRLIREERGYSYGVHSAFEMRRAAGPFAVRMAVETVHTLPATIETLGVLRAMTEQPPTAEEMDVSRDYLIGVFPLRFEAASQVAAALSGLVVHGLPDDELDRYRPSIAAVSADDVLDAGRRHVRPADLSIVIVGDATQIEPSLRSAELGPVSVVGHDAPVA